MAETVSLRDKKSTRWLVLVLASFSIFGAYYFNYALSPVKGMLESVLGWTSTDFGTYTSAYGWFNVFLFMLIISGIILDKLGIRKTGLGATVVMFIGTLINYWAVTTTFPEGARIFGLKAQVFWSAIGFAIFGVGTEAVGITVSKAVVRWFKGKEMALAMGMQMSIARLGTLLALAISLPLAKHFTVTAPIALALILMLIGIISFLTFSVFDRKLDASEKDLKIDNSEDEFRIKDIGVIISNRGFWYIAILCVLFYSAVFPFMFYATDLVINKYHVSPEFAGLIPSLLPFGTIILTPLFGGIYDTKGKGATIMLIGAIMLVFVHGVLAIPFLNHWLIASVMVIILGIAFSLVPSAMWPSVPKIIPEKQLGTAYAVIFWIQNIGLLSIPLLLGFVLDKTNPDVSQNKEFIKSTVETTFKNALPKNVFSEKEINIAFEKTTSGAVDSIVQYSNYQPVENNLIDKTKLSEDLNNKLKTSLAAIDFKSDKKKALNRAIKLSQEAIYETVSKYKLNLIYNYTYDMLIFVTLTILAVLFAILLKREDKIKGYGLEEPNIKK